MAFTRLPSEMVSLEDGRTVQDKLRERVSVLDYMTPAQIADVQGRTALIDVTAAIQAALNTGKSVYFPKGTYLTGPLTVPLLACGSTYFGEGANYYQSGANIRGSVLVARDDAQQHIFYHANGADSVTYRGLRLDGNNKALKLIDGTYGAWITLHDCKLHRFVDYGFYNRQGLARIENCYFHTQVYSGLGIGASLYSDWNITNSEFSNGNIPLEIVAGGGRGVNVLANSGRNTCVRMAPLNSSTTHINTSFSNCYFGEVVAGAVSRPIIEMIGLASQRIQQVQFANSHLVSSRTAESEKINGGIFMDYCREVSINGVVMLGLADAGVTASRYTDYFVKATRSSFVAVSNCVTKSINRNNFVLDAGCFGWSIIGNVLAEPSAVAVAISDPTDGACIKIADSVNYGAISGNVVDSSSASTAPYAVEGGNPARWVFDANMIRYASATIWNPATGVLAGGFQRMGSQPVPRGQISGSATYDPPSLADGEGTTTAVTVTGAALGDAVTAISFSNGLQGVTVTGWVSAANTVSVRFQNETGAAVDLASGTLRVRVLKIV